MTGGLDSRPDAASYLPATLGKSHNLSVLPIHRDVKELKLYCEWKLHFWKNDLSVYILLISVWCNRKFLHKIEVIVSLVNNYYIKISFPSLGYFSCSFQSTECNIKATLTSELKEPYHYRSRENTQLN